MGPDAVAVAELAVTGVLWLAVVTALALLVSGRLPGGAGKAETRTARTGLTALAAMMTMSLLDRIANAAHWPWRAEMTISTIGLVVSIGAAAVMIRSAAMFRRTRAAAGPGGPTGASGPADGG